jgi:hypothetical protein
VLLVVADHLVPISWHRLCNFEYNYREIPLVSNTTRNTANVPSLPPHHTTSETVNTGFFAHDAKLSLLHSIL